MWLGSEAGYLGWLELISITNRKVHMVAEVLDYEDQYIEDI